MSLSFSHGWFVCIIYQIWLLQSWNYFKHSTITACRSGSMVSIVYVNSSSMLKDNKTTGEKAILIVLCMQMKMRREKLQSNEREKWSYRSYSFAHVEWCSRLKSICSFGRHGIFFHFISFYFTLYDFIEQRWQRQRQQYNNNNNKNNDVKTSRKNYGQTTTKYRIRSLFSCCCCRFFLL